MIIVIKMMMLVMLPRTFNDTRFKFTNRELLIFIFSTYMYKSQTEANT